MKTFQGLLHSCGPRGSGEAEHKRHLPSASKTPAVTRKASTAERRQGGPTRIRAEPTRAWAPYLLAGGAGVDHDGRRGLVDDKLGQADLDGALLRRGGELSAEEVPLLATSSSFDPGWTSDTSTPGVRRCPRGLLRGYRSNRQGEHGLTDDGLRNRRPAATAPPACAALSATLIGNEFRRLPADQWDMRIRREGQQLSRGDPLGGAAHGVPPHRC